MVTLSALSRVNFPFACKIDYISPMLELLEKVNQDRVDISRGRARYDSKTINDHAFHIRMIGNIIAIIHLIATYTLYDF